jgi:hypothetical protein
MADQPNISGSEAELKPLEASKVQPKKETVRISLPPKPSATIKLPSIPVGAPASSPHAASSSAAKAPPAPPSSRAAAAVPPPPAPPASSAPRNALSNVAGPRPGGAAPAGAPVPPAGRHAAPPAPSGSKTVGGLDIGLAIAAVVVALGALGYIYFGILTLQ